MNTSNLNTVKERVDFISQNKNLSLETPYTTCKIEICGICNMKCRFCYQKILSSNGIRQKFMPMEDFKLVLKVLKEKVPTLKEVGLFYMGEAGLNPNLPDMYKLCKEEGYFTYLTTNGLSITNILPAIEFIDSLKVSWNYKNFFDFSYKTNLKSKLSYKQIKTNTYELQKECHKYNKKLTVSTILDPNDKKEDYETSLKEIYYDDHYWIPLQTQAGYKDIGFDGVIGEYDNVSTPIPCWSLFKGIYIDSELNIRTCCYGHTDEFIIGNIKNNPNFNKDVYKSQHLKEEIPEICKNCLKHSI